MGRPLNPVLSPWKSNPASSETPPLPPPLLVLSSHPDPDLELSGSGLRNLSALVHLGNSLEVRNHVSLLSGILNRLSLHTEANTHTQRHTRNTLIRTVCELESNGQASMEDNICILKNLLEVTRQVTIASARRVAAHVQDVSRNFPESGGPASYRLEQNTLHSLLSLLSFSLQSSTRADLTHMLDPDPREEASRGGGGSISTKQVEHLVADILKAASDLMLKFILMHKVQEHRVSTGLIALYSSYQNRSSTVISSGSASFSLPPSLIQLVHGSRPRCVLSTLTELRHSPFTWDPDHRRLSGPVVELSLNQCSSRRKIPVRSLIEPIIIQLKQPSNNESSEREYVLLRSRVNHHSFNLTQKHLQQAIQLSVVFTPPSKPFPIMLLFRMFERPTPSMHHLQGIHSWKSNVTRFTLPSSYLSAAGVGHVALLDADFGKRPGAPPLSEQVSYSLSVDSSLCLSWDGQQGAWSPRGCRTQQTASPDVTCSCHQLRPLTVERQQIHSSHETTHLDPFLSARRDLTVLLVLLLCLSLSVPALLLSFRADVASETHRRVHYLSDNCPCDPYLYAVTIHTALCSAARMSAKVRLFFCGRETPSGGNTGNLADR
ncbi:hypothetical protein CesoFtcFv8_024959 [Champsocephalus esox]|uniref:GAIN-B domain-containing protein n=1 Tax=Champsocephalus esox TaxID=159716 RepID=A0AAN8B3E3_9TELE|nr:hypothetical protein CesoFtcFv8_024959 [Champsocephalus esox]